MLFLLFPQPPNRRPQGFRLRSFILIALIALIALDVRVPRVVRARRLAPRRRPRRRRRARRRRPRPRARASPDPRRAHRDDDRARARPDRHRERSRASSARRAPRAARELAIVAPPRRRVVSRVRRRRQRRALARRRVHAREIGRALGSLAPRARDVAARRRAPSASRGADAWVFADTCRQATSNCLPTRSIARASHRRSKGGGSQSAALRENENARGRCMAKPKTFSVYSVNFRSMSAKRARAFCPARASPSIRATSRGRGGRARATLDRPAIARAGVRRARERERARANAASRTRERERTRTRARIAVHASRARARPRVVDRARDDRGRGRAGVARGGADDIRAARVEETGRVVEQRARLESKVFGVEARRRRSRAAGTHLGAAARDEVASGDELWDRERSHVVRAGAREGVLQHR